VEGSRRNTETADIQEANEGTCSRARRGRKKTGGGGEKSGTRINAQIARKPVYSNTLKIHGGQGAVRYERLFQ